MREIPLLLRGRADTDDFVLSILVRFSTFRFHRLRSLPLGCHGAYHCTHNRPDGKRLTIGTIVSTIGLMSANAITHAPDARQKVKVKGDGG